MPDSESSPPLDAASNFYTSPAPAATPVLADLLRARIAAQGPLPFPEFMATALYHPELGYYARGTAQVGRSGDFFTSVSVGPLFGALLARHFLGWWRDAGRPSPWRIIESGAHDGTLAADVLTTLRDLDPAAYAALEYAIPEPLPRLRAAQRETLCRFQPQTRHAGSLSEIAAQPLPGIAFANELLDALPFHVVEFRDGCWHACHVTCAADGGFCWTLQPADPALSAALTPLGFAYPDGYRTEVRTGVSAWLDDLLPALSYGRLLWFDYGFARPEFYHPDRTQGTLRTFARHRAGDDPLQYPGSLDLTAHVDFTAIAETALAAGCRLLGFRNQGSWLTATARDWLLAMDDSGPPDPALLRQFQTLTHPAQLGGRFHVLEMAWQMPGATATQADWHRLALTL